MASGKTSAIGTPSNHRWRFFRAGGFDQALLETGADLSALEALDQKLWVALSCPVDGIEFDRKTLELVDSDGDGHIRAPEILGAVRWAASVLRDPDLLVKRRDRVPLSAIDDRTDEGRAVLAGARLVLGYLGKPDAPEITLEDVSDTARIFDEARFNGDGVVPPQAAGDPALAAVIGEIMECVGRAVDRSGADGVTADAVERFYAEAKALADWRAAASQPGVLRFGENTDSLFPLFESVRAKVDDYFRRCALAAYDGRAAALLSPADSEYQKLAGADLSRSDEGVRQLPLAVPGRGASLPLRDGVNPAWAGELGRFGAEVAAPFLGSADAMTEEGWRAVCGAFAPYEAWLSARPATAVEGIDPVRLREILDAGGKDGLLDLVAKDRAVEPEVTAIASVERLLRYCRDLHLLVNNFVSFSDFYTRKGKATFQSGTLYLDGRSCDLCVAVNDPNRHAALATLSRVFLVYCECVRQGGGEKVHIAAGFTAGDSDQLMVGRNGVYYDRRGRDWDATIVRIVEHPISIRQAFFAPYKRIARTIGEQFEKLSAARAKAAEERAAAAALARAERAATGKPAAAAPPTPFDVGKFAGIFAAIGLAIGAIGTALAAVVTGLLKLPWWQLPLLFAGILLLISGFSMVAAWLQLRKRTLGPILDANGWAVNARARINVPFGASLTAAARLPEGAERSLADPFAGKGRPWLLYVVLLSAAGLLLGLWRYGCLARWFGG